MPPQQLQLLPIDPQAAPTAGLRIWRASRVEALLEPLIELLDAVPPAAVLAPQRVIAAHPGMRHWLVGALARRRGRGGIVANLEVELFSSWSDRLSRELLGQSAVSLRAYARERLRWWIFAALDGFDDARIGEYLSGPEPQRRRFQLADRLAGLYTQYMIYRPDWLAAWEAGDDGVAAGSFQPALWRRVRGRVGARHRGELMVELAHRFVRGAGEHDGAPLHVFGFSYLAQAEMSLLAAAARHRLVVLYAPDPCRHYWYGLPEDPAALSAAATAAPFEAEAEGRFLGGIGHPLLALWGRLGQHFMLRLADAGASSDVRHWRDEPAAQQGERHERCRGLLHGLQEGIRQLDPTLTASLPELPAHADPSLRIHACHTRLRELEVLRDALLRARLDDPSIQPSDMVVMAPDIDAYVSLLGAVFGPAGDADAALPYHLADVPLSRAHGLLAAFARLLALPGSRFSAPDVADLLEVPEVAAALGLDGGEVGTALDWLRAAGAAWGIDADDRARFDVPAIAACTFAWGMDRLLAGYAFGGEAGAVRLPDGAELLPVAGVQGPQAAVVGALDTLVSELAGFCRDAEGCRRASEWRQRIERRVDALFRIDPRDRAAREALSVLRRSIRALELETDAIDPPLDFAVVRELLAERLATASERQRHLLGGVTFCGMVPQRSIPYRLVAVLGLDDGEFPREARDGGLNLMLQPGRRRIGDRDPRAEDRYLFLETVMAARDRLHLSYIGEGAKDGRPRNPAAPLAELIAFLRQHAPRPAEEGGPARKLPEPRWLVRHPLQPFDSRYFDGGDARLFSFDADLAGAHPGAPPKRFVDAAVDAIPDPRIAFPRLLAWYKDPARAVLQQSLDLRLDALDRDHLPDSEPLAPKFEAIERVGRRVLLEALQAGERQAPPEPPDWLRLGPGFPPGRAGREAWETERDGVDALLELAYASPPFAGALPRRIPRHLLWQAGGFEIDGKLDEVFDDGVALWLVAAWPGKSEKDLGFRHRAPYFLQWALLRLATADATPVHACILAKPGKGDGFGASFAHWCAGFAAAGDGDRARLRAGLQARVDALVALYVQARQRPLPYFPKTSWTAANDPHGERVVAAWEGEDRSRGERDHEPGYARLLAGDACFEPGTADFIELQALALRIVALIDLSKEPPADG